MITEQFKNWACSLSGCDGGDPKATIWLSGIEWGGDDEKYYQELPEEISKGEYVPPIKYDWKEQLRHRFGMSLAKLFSAIHGHDVSNYRNYAEGLPGNELFKLNLYPIAFERTDRSLWRKYKLNEITGFEEKELFKAWCFINRFPAMSKRVQTYKPKIIIGTGVSYLVDFFTCYASGQELKDVIHIDSIGDRNMYWAKIADNTHLFVVPFFSGSFGLNSDALLQQFGARIKEISNYEE